MTKTRLLMLQKHCGSLQSGQYVFLLSSSDRLAYSLMMVLTRISVILQGAVHHPSILTILSKLILKLRLCFGHHFLLYICSIKWSHSNEIQYCKYGHRACIALLIEWKVNWSRNSLLCFMCRVNAISSMAGTIMSTIFIGTLDLQTETPVVCEWNRSQNTKKVLVQKGQRLRFRFRNELLN